MKIVPHINFAGKCREAFVFYEQVLGGALALMLTWGDSPMAAQIPFEWHDKICHATLRIGDQELAGVDDPNTPEPSLNGFQIILDVDSEVEAEGIFATLQTGGAVKVALQETFWAKRYGLVTDRFGVNWEINYSQR